MSTPNAPEPPPITNDSRPIWELVIEDMRERDEQGRVKYGTPLQAFNGRRPEVDAYQEVLDLAVYLRQLIEERRAMEREVELLRADIQRLRRRVPVNATDIEAAGFGVDSIKVWLLAAGWARESVQTSGAWESWKSTSDIEAQRRRDEAAKAAGRARPPSLHAPRLCIDDLQNAASLASLVQEMARQFERVALDLVEELKAIHAATVARESSGG